MGLIGDNPVARSAAMTADADRHLLFGLLALQNAMVTRDQLVAAFGAGWERPAGRWPTIWSIRAP